MHEEKIVKHGIYKCAFHLPGNANIFIMLTVMQTRLIRVTL